MDIQAAEISAILKSQIKNFGAEAEVSEIGQVLSVGDGIARIYGLAPGAVGSPSLSGAITLRLGGREEALALVVQVLIAGKAWVEGDLHTTSREFGGDIRHEFNVAPMILVGSQQVNHPWVLDPAFAERPVPFDDWKTLVAGGGKSNASATKRCRVEGFSVFNTCW